MLKDILLVGAGGFAGCVCRYLVSAGLTGLSFLSPFPAATFTVNIIGSLFIGFLISVAMGSPSYLLLATGFCGGFTTFSTFSAETLMLFREGHHTTALIYIAASVTVCVLFVWAGIVLGNKTLKI